MRPSDRTGGVSVASDETDPGKASTRSPLLAALDQELIVLERAVARASQAVSGVGFLIAVVVGLFITPVMGRTLAIGAALFVGWFTLARYLLARDRRAALRAYRLASPIVEIMVPAVALILTALTQGPAYALASWVPPILFAILIFLSIVRLKPYMPVAMGLAGAVEYLVVYYLFLRGAQGSGHIDDLIARPQMQFIRASSIILLGSIGALGSAALRRAVGLAARQARASELFGKYRIGEPIAAGGMGTVYEALYCPEGGFERKVAIKRVHPHLARDPESVASFRLEAELSARLTHPNIVAVFDFGVVEDTYFFAMEHVEGMDLLRLRKRAKGAGILIPSPLVALIGREIAEGLAFAHEGARDGEGNLLRIVHRDLNPSNVLVSRTGQVKISDFGIARALGESAKYETRSFVGKVPYFAPEQARGEAFDARADLFSLGLVIWELLCLRPVYQRESDAETLLALINTTAPRPSTVRADLAGGPWDDFCAKALAPDPGQRFQTAREMSAALTRIIDELGVPRPDELPLFVRSVENAPAVSSSELPAVESDADIVKTVKEIT